MTEPIRTFGWLNNLNTCYEPPSKSSKSSKMLDTFHFRLSHFSPTIFGQSGLLTSFDHRSWDILRLAASAERSATCWHFVSRTDSCDFQVTTLSGSKEVDRGIPGPNLIPIFTRPSATVSPAASQTLPPGLPAAWANWGGDQLLTQLPSN